MAIAAVPEYLKEADFSSASPGMRFNMYLQVWGVDLRSGEILWGLQDSKYETRGQERRERRVQVDNKAPALNEAGRLNALDRQIMQALLARQEHGFANSVAPDDGLIIDAQATAPFATGLGNEHPVENGFAFLYPYGLPYLPGSGVKGVLRAAARELASGEWGDPQGWDAHAIDALFGPVTDAPDDDRRRGALIFWDVIPQLKGDRLHVEVMTPHQKHYYQDGKSPHDSGQPIPISFLTVPPGSGFTFHVQCDRALLSRTRPQLLENGMWRTLLRAAFEHAFQWLGFGAKTSVGYGAMKADQARQLEREARVREREERERQERERAERERAIAAMDPIDRAMAECFEARADKNQPEISALISALQQDRFPAEIVGEVARRLKHKMEVAGQWVPESRKKRPDKDKEYQRTLLVMKYLENSP